MENVGETLENVLKKYLWVSDKGKFTYFTFLFYLGKKSGNNKEGEKMSA